MEPAKTENLTPSVESPKPTISEVGYKAGKERYDRMVARIETVKKLAFTALGAPEMAGEATKRGWEATVNKANEIKMSVKEKITAANEAARLQRDKAVNVFIEKTKPIRDFASEKRDQIVNKATEIGTATARTVAAGAEAAVAGVEFGVGVAVTGAMAVEAGFRWTLAEAQAKPIEIKAGIHEGIAGVAHEVAKSLRVFEKNNKQTAETHRVSAAAIRTRYGISV